METGLVVDVVKLDLTRELNKVTEPLTQETSYALQLLLTDAKGTSAERPSLSCPTPFTTCLPPSPERKRDSCIS